MVITSTDFQKDIGKHFESVDKGEEVIITVRGTQKYKITKINKIDIIKQLAGKYNNIDTTLDKSKDERINTKYGTIAWHEHYNWFFM